MADCIFCKIINGEIPSAKVFEDDVVYAFLDITQATKGHTLVIPKKHVADIFEYDADLASELFARVPKIARAIESSLEGVEGLNIINNNREVAYQTVFHSHIHLIPRYQKNDGLQIEFADNSALYTMEDLDVIAQKINNDL